MDKVKTRFLQSQSLQPLIWFRYIDDIFFSWTCGKDKFEKFLDDPKKFYDNIKFTLESSKENVTLILIVKLSKSCSTIDLYINDTD